MVISYQGNVTFSCMPCKLKDLYHCTNFIVFYPTTIDCYLRQPYSIKRDV